MQRGRAWLVVIVLLGLQAGPGVVPAPLPVVAQPPPGHLFGDGRGPTQAAEAVEVVKRPARDIEAHQPRIIYGALVTRPLVALTFDLDMSPAMVAQLRAGRVKPWVNQEALALLQQSGIHATLFMTGMWAEVNPELARRLAASPQFEIGNHSYAHAAYHLPCYRLAGLSRAGLAADLGASQATIERITGVRPVYFRFPGGCYDPAALDAVHVAGLIPVQWTLNSGDAFNPYAEQIAWTVVHGVRPGAIVMMHLHGGPNAPASGAALRIILPALKQMGYEFVTLSELLAAGSIVGPTDPRETVEALPPPEPRVSPQPRWCASTRASKTVWVRC
jgi:peptidoglycan/xylan/chitin deacetylase (PgdA/CDA1 family)